MRQELQRRITALSAEIRNYPTPIARCDEQLGGLLERRARLVERLERADETRGGCTPAATWINDGGFHGA